MVKVTCYGNTFDLDKDDLVMFDGFSYRIITRTGSPKIPKHLARKLIWGKHLNLAYVDRKGNDIYVIGDVVE